jgi:hypothetical protein
MIIVLCLPQDAPITINNMNYSPIALGIVILGAFSSWVLSARFWFKGMFLPPDQVDFFKLTFHIVCVFQGRLLFYHCQLYRFLIFS